MIATSDGVGAGAEPGALKRSRDDSNVDGESAAKKACRARLALKLAARPAPREVGRVKLPPKSTDDESSDDDSSDSENDKDKDVEPAVPVPVGKKGQGLPDALKALVGAVVTMIESDARWSATESAMVYKALKSRATADLAAERESNKALVSKVGTRVLMEARLKGSKTLKTWHGVVVEHEGKGVLRTKVDVRFYMPPGATEASGGQLDPAVPVDVSRLRVAPRCATIAAPAERALALESSFLARERKWSLFGGKAECKEATAKLNWLLKCCTKKTITPYMIKWLQKSTTKSAVKTTTKDIREDLKLDSMLRLLLSREDDATRAKTTVLSAQTGMMDSAVRGEFFEALMEYVGAFF
jgi:hypothetical protein